MKIFNNMNKENNKNKNIYLKINLITYNIRQPSY